VIRSLRSAIIVIALLTGAPYTTTAIAENADVELKISSDVYAGIGDYFELDLILSENQSATGFDSLRLLVKYDTLAMDFLAGYAGSVIEDCGWESLLCYEESPGLIRIVGVADLETVPGVPSCYLNGVNGPIAIMTFNATQDSSYNCQWFPVQFYWEDCEDNLLRGAQSDSLFSSLSVYQARSSSNIWEVTANDTFPTTSGAPDSCLAIGDGHHRARYVDYYHGGVNLLCTDMINQRGDLNLNEIAYEIADMVLFANYFLYGIEVFTIDPFDQIAASDVNADSLTLTVRDITYLGRVIVGDALPYPKSEPLFPAPAIIYQDTETNTVSVEYGDTLATVFLLFSDSIAPTLDSVVTEKLILPLYQDYVDGETRILVTCAAAYVDSNRGIVTGPLLMYEGEGHLKQAEVADFHDLNISAIIASPLPLDIDGVVLLINYIFVGGYIPYPTESGDVNCDEVTDIDDVVYLIEYIFAGGPAPYADCL
jgi:hypothetical protein